VAPESNYEHYQEFVNYLLKDRNEGFEALDELFRMVDDTTVWPVYYELDEVAAEAEGRPMPAHPIRVHGFHEFLEEVTA